MDCLFCNIIEGNIPSAKVYEDDLCYAFRDIAPQAKAHIILVPKKHIEALSSAQLVDQTLLGHLMLAAARIAVQEGIAADGYRVVTNVGQNGCQSVKHIHFHILGGEKLSEKLS